MPNDQTIMTPYHKTDLGELYCGDSLLVLPQLKDNFVDTILTDPPYALTTTKRWGKDTKFSRNQSDVGKRFTKGFMGQTWDGALPPKEIWVEYLRVAKPGAMMLVFGGDRTHHRLMVDIEDAGFEIRTCIYWLYGSGFPKSLDISKAIDKVAGAKGKKVDYIAPDGKKRWGGNTFSVGEPPNGRGINKRTLPATPEAKRFAGYGSGLKPAVEIIVLAMAPLDGTFAENALKHGVAGLAIDKARIPVGPEGLTKGGCTKWGGIFGSGDKCSNPDGHPKGRYPSNLLLSHSPECRQTGVKKAKVAWSQPKRGNLDGSMFNPGNREYGKPVGYADPDGTETVPAYECAAGCPCGHVWSTEKLMPCPECGCRKTEWICAVKMLDEQAGELQSGARKGNDDLKLGRYADQKGHWGLKKGGTCEASQGGASRFFYTSKSSRTEREQGLKGHIPCVKCGELDTDFHLDDKGDKVKCVRNNHSTVKPLSIIEYLCRLTETPTKGIVLDPFLGSGTTAVACEKLGRKWIGIELSQSYCEIAKARLSKPQQMAMAL